jgi:hypothetical protein
MAKIPGETQFRSVVERAAEWLVVAFASLMALVSTLRLLGILS